MSADSANAGPSRIKVQRHAEPDVVIHAGAWPADDRATAGREAPDAEAEGALVDGAVALGADAAAVDAEAVGEGPASIAAQAAAPVADGFRETTLEDIETSRMGALQKGIIVIAVLALIACIAWYALS